MTEAEQRAAVVAEAKEFLHTAYHHRGTLKISRDAQGGIIDRGGVDCAWFPFLVYRAVGLIPEIDFGDYPPDWFLHRDEERYLTIVQSVAKEIESPSPGDFILWKVGRLYAHGAIVIDWPIVIHAHRLVGHVTMDHGDGGWLGDKEHKFFTVWGRNVPAQ